MSSVKRQVSGVRRQASSVKFYVLRFTFYVLSHFNLQSLLILFTLLTLYQSITLPLGEADDETDHYQYLRFVARTGHPPFSEAERREAGFKGGLAPLYYWLTAWPIALVGEDALPDIRRVDARPERLIPGDGLSFNHVLHTLDEQWPWRGQTLAWHLVRLLSLPLGWVTIIATYALARRLLPEPKTAALLAAAFVAFLPRFVSSSAVINDDNLVFALTSLLLLIQVVILQNDSSSSRLFAFLGALVGLALITKYFSLILIPEVIFTLVVSSRAAGSKAAGNRVAGSKVASSKVADHPITTGDSLPTADRLLIPEASPVNSYAPHTTHHALRITHHAPRTTLLPFLLALALTAGPWFAFITVRFNRISELGLIPGLAASLGEPQITEGLVGLLSGHSVRPVAATYPLAEWFGLLYRSFWFEFGWMQIFAPRWVYALFTIFLLIAVSGHILRFTFYVLRSTHYPSHITQQSQRFPGGAPRTTLLLTLHFTLFLIVVLARYVLSATIDTGQGRHLYPALPVIAFFIALGLNHLRLTIGDLRLTNRVRPLALLAFGVPTPYYLLLTICYLLPALFSLQPSFFILPHYPALPITTTPPADLPIQYRYDLEFAPGLSWAGFDAPQTTAKAGGVLPITLYWHAGREAQQDYLVSLCLQDETGRPAACWRGQFVNGHYPARAWETGDTLRDQVFIPIPTCYRLSAQTYRLRLELWPLRPDSPQPTLADAPVLQQILAEPRFTLQPTDSGRSSLPQTVDLWQGNERLTGPAEIQLGESLAWLTYAGSRSAQAPAFEQSAGGTTHRWSPLPQLDTPLFLPCADGPSPFAHLSHFIAGPTLPPGPYLPNDPAANLTLTLALRQRTLAPLTTTLTFSHTLAPLSLQIPGQPAINLEDWKTGGLEDKSNPSTFHPSTLPTLPITLRWHTLRWMADPLVISLKLVDKDFQVGGERVATLGDRYPNVLWVPTEIVEETYPLRLNPDAPPGLYRLEISLLRQDKSLPDGYEYLPLCDGQTGLGYNNLYPLTVRLLDPADGTAPPHPLLAQLNQTIQLTGYNLTPNPITNPQLPISLTLYWKSTAPIPTDYTVFTQLIGPDGQVWAQWDNPPQAGRYPTSAWAKQDSVVDRYTLTLRDGAPPGAYRLLVGMYDPATGQRLPAAVNGRPQPDNAVELAILTFDN